MSIDAVQPTLSIPAVYPRQDANRQSGREPQRDGKPKSETPERQEQEPLFLNSLGQLIGKTINVTA